MSRAFGRALLLAALCVAPVGAALAADGFPGIEVVLAREEPACRALADAWDRDGHGWLLRPYWGVVSTAAEGGIETLAATEDAALDEEIAPSAERATGCDRGGMGGAGWPSAAAPGWQPFGAAGPGTVTSSFGHDGGTTEGAVWTASLPVGAFWSAVPVGAGPAISSIIDGRLATPARTPARTGAQDGDDDEDGGTHPGEDPVLVTAEPPPRPGGIAAVMPEPSTMLVVGLAMLALGLLRRGHG